MFSPAEMIRQILDGVVDVDVVIGPASDAQQQAGVVSCVDAGMPTVDKYSPIVWTRTQWRVLAGTLAEAEKIARDLQVGLQDFVRIKVTQADGYSYLVHRLDVDAGPSMHYDSAETNEVLLFASAMIGTTPIDSPA